MRCVCVCCFSQANLPEKAAGGMQWIVPQIGRKRCFLRKPVFASVLELLPVELSTPMHQTNSIQFNSDHINQLAQQSENFSNFTFCKLNFQLCLVSWSRSLLGPWQRRPPVLCSPAFGADLWMPGHLGHWSSFHGGKTFSDHQTVVSHRFPDIFLPFSTLWPFEPDFAASRKRVSTLVLEIDSFYKSKHARATQTFTHLSSP